MANTPINITGMNGTAGTNGANPTPGGKGQNAPYTLNGTIGADSMTINAKAGKGGKGGNGNPGKPGANGGDGGDASITLGGNIFNAPATTTMAVLATSTGGDGGTGGTGTPPGVQGNGGNAAVTMSGNILQTSKTMSDVELNAQAVGGVGARYGNATATLSGNILQPTKATNATLEAAAYSNPLTGSDSIAHDGDPAFGTKTAIVSGNVMQGNITNANVFADAYYSNASASMTANIVTDTATSATVTLETTGQHIDIEQNKVNVTGTTTVALMVNEFGPNYDVTIKGNDFEGTGKNTFVFDDIATPGPNPNTAVIDLSQNSFMFDGKNNKLKGFTNVTMGGNENDSLTGDANNNILIGGSGNDLITGGGGNDTIDGAGGSFDTAVYSGTHNQYTISLSQTGNLAGTVTDHVAGRDGMDTLQNIEFLKFSDGIYDVVAGQFLSNDHAPVAVNDSFTTPENAALSVPATGVLANDTDADNDPLTAVLVTGPAHGSLTLNPNGGFLYTPTAGYKGADSFTYEANDGTLNSNVATVNLTIADHAPVAVNDSYTTLENTALTVPAAGVLANDTDADGDTLTAAVVTGPSHGSLTLNPNGSFLYTPTAGYRGADSFTYQANDGTLNSNTATVTLTITDHAPVANNDIYATFKNTTLTIPATGVLTNDTDADNDPLTSVLVTGPSHGSLALNPNGSFTYTPNTGFNGTDSFTYQANDGTLNSNTATVTLAVGDHQPIAFNDTYTFPSNAVLNVPQKGVLTNDTDADGDPLTAAVVTGPAHGSLTLNADGSFTYTPFAPNTNGTDSFTYQASDGTLNSNTATVTLNYHTGDTHPVANNDTYTVAGNTTLTVPAAGILTNDTDADGDTLTVAISTFTNHGSLLLNQNGSFTYTPNAGFVGTDTFQYEATDGALTSNTATVTFHVTGPDHAPVANGESYGVEKNVALVIPAVAGVLANDTDADNDPLTSSLVANAAHGNVVLNTDGSFTYTPNAGFTGADSFTYQDNDGQLNSNIATVNLTITDQAPVANNDSYNVAKNVPLTVTAATGVLTNDTDANGDPLTSSLVANATHGNVVLNTDGSFTYTPNAGFTGADSFTYKDNDGTLNSNTATVNLTVGSADHAPVANNDAFSTLHDTPLTVAPAGVLANDTDADGDPLTAAVVTGPAHGSLTLNTNGSFNYTPTAGYVGADSFTYQANDGTLDSNTATVNLTVTDHAPVATNDAYGTGENTPLVVGPALGVQGNDIDADGDTLTSTVVTGPAHGALTLNTDGSFTYNPTAGFHGTDSFTYQDNDGALNSNTATVNLSIIDHAPVANNDSYTTGENTVLQVLPTGVLSNDTDADGDPLTAALVTPASHGNVTLNANGSFTYAPTGGFHGTDSFTYQANDGTLNSNTATVTLTVNDHAPVANNDSYTTGENTVLQVLPTGVLSNDTDADGDPLTANLVTPASHGNVTLNADGSFTYAPTGGFHGTDSFTYQANDGTLDSNTATVTLTVNDHAPVANNDSYTTGENTGLLVLPTGVLSNDTDADGDPLTANLVTPASHGNLTLNANGSFTYTPNAGFIGTDSFTYQANDGTLNSNTATVTLTVNDHAPVANNDSYTTGENTGLLVLPTGVLSNDTDADGDPLTANLVTPASHGNLTLNANGSFTYTPNAGFIGTDSFTYQANDGTLNSNTATVTLTVNDHAPVANNDSYTTGENTVLQVLPTGVLSNDTDADGDPLTANLVTPASHGNLTLNANGSFTYTPTAGFIGTDSFTYQANDGTLNSNTATVTLTVNDHAPVANNDSYTTGENTPLTVAAAGVLTNDTDADSDPLTAALVTGPANGTLTLNTDGSFTYTPNAGFRGADSFTYQANDGTLNSNTATVNLTITDHAPVAADDSYTTDENSVLTVAAATGVQANDTDPDSDPLTSSVVTGPSHGALTLNTDGSFTYTPTAGYAGADSFTYKDNDGTLDSNTATVNLTVTKFPSLTRVSDLDDNGVGDLVFQNGGTIQIRSNPGSVEQTPNITGIGNYKAIGTGLFTTSTNHDASILLQKQAGAGNLEILTQTTGAATPTTITTTPGAGWVAIATGDFNGDGTSDILLQNGANAKIMFTTGTTGTTGVLASTSAPFAAPVGYTAVSSGDFDGDGKSDILWSNGTSVEFTTMNGAAITSNSGAIADGGMTVVGTGDFNGDGKSDILFQNASGQAVVWTMNGNTIGTTSTFNAPTAAGTWSVAGAEDLDGNGASDIIWHDSVAGNVRATMMNAPGVGANPLVAPSVLSAQKNFGSPNQNFTVIASTGGG